jgi:aspartyl-tRNA(Asn)/glutamyl-tRNA(Gln) amidotransferase subunit B
MDEDGLAGVLDEVIAQHHGAWEKFVSGDDKVQGALIGQVMRQTKGKANGEAVAAELNRRRRAVTA